MDFDVVLFDLGGVLVELTGVATMRDLAGIDDDAELWRRWLGCPWVSRFERGECSAADFADGLIAEWGLAVTAEQFLAAFCDWPRAPYPGALELVTETRTRLPVGCLSNTNAVHWGDHFSAWPLLGAFDTRFLSFELGLVKPDPALFERVASALAVMPARILFLDDNRINADGAAAAGFTAVVVRGVDEARAALVEGGVLGIR